MKILLAQGNPGPDYAHTRHNVGWLLLDLYADKYGAPFKPEKKFFADIATLSIAGEKVLLVKPTTFYNETGRTARALVDFYKLAPANDLLVLHDDIALPIGTVRVRPNGSDAGNNGIKSLTAHLGPDYWRIRVGVHDSTRPQTGAVNFVLGTFSKASLEAIKKDILPYVETKITEFIDGSITSSSATVLPQD